MHPILGSSGRLLLYLATWLPVGALLSLLVALVDQVGWAAAGALAFPLSLIYAFICLASWYPSRGTPLSRANAWRVASTHAVAAVMSSCIWQLAVVGWAFALNRMPIFAGAFDNSRRQLLLFFVFGLLLYLLAAAGSYLVIAFETSHEAEKRALEASA